MSNEIRWFEDNRYLFVACAMVHFPGCFIQTDLWGLVTHPKREPSQLCSLFSFSAISEWWIWVPLCTSVWPWSVRILYEWTLPSLDSIFLLTLPKIVHSIIAGLWIITLSPILKLSQFQYPLLWAMENWFFILCLTVFIIWQSLPNMLGKSPLVLLSKKRDNGVAFEPGLILKLSSKHA